MEGTVQPVTPAQGRARQDDPTFEVCLGYTEWHHQGKAKSPTPFNNNESPNLSNKRLTAEIDPFSKTAYK